MLPLIQHDGVREKCAVFGVYGVGSGAARTTLYGLWALQHRGQESSGIVSSDGHSLYRHCGKGLVAHVYHEEDLEQLPGDIAIGHNRYSTFGSANDAHSQPVIKRDTKFAFAHNGNLPQTDKVEAFLSKRGISCVKLNDSEMMGEAINCFVSDGMSLPDAVKQAYPLFEGAFSCVAMGDDCLLAFRDAYGIRPLSIGTLDSGYVVASETCALDTVGATFMREVQPGELVVIDRQGLSSHQVVAGTLKLDIFEFVYFARPDSMLGGKSVYGVRFAFGKELARENTVTADIVVPVPDSAIPAALGYSRTSGIPLEMALTKNRYIHRTFIRPSSRLRQQDLKMKLNPIPSLLKDQRVVLVDDSIVRGTTMQKIVKMLYEAGAKEVHILISSPPVRFPDFYGIDLSDQRDLIAARMSETAICKELGADSLNYLSYDGMIKATGLPARNFSTSCFNGEYPIPIGARTRGILQFAPQRPGSLRHLYSLLA